jgi:hypothetical protein
VKVGPAPEAAAQSAPPLNVANAGPVPSRRFVLPVAVVTVKVGPPLGKSRVAPAERVIAPTPSVIDPPPADVARRSVCPAATAVPPRTFCVTGVVVFAIRFKTPPLRVSAPPPSLGAVLVE